MSKTKVLLVGESWVSAATHYKGFDQFGSVTFHLGAEPLVKALKGSEFELDYMPAHEAVEKLPFTIEGLSPLRRDDPLRYRRQLVAPPSRRLAARQDGAEPAEAAPRLDQGRRRPRHDRRLSQLPGHRRQGALAADAGRRGVAGDCLPYDDRIEVPEGFRPVPVRRSIRSLPASKGEWPVLLGANEVIAKDRAGVEVLAHCLPDDRRPSAARHRALRQGPHGGLDVRHRPALAAHQLRRMARLCAPLEERA